jgi:transcriptional regulator with XRE-family HTH domain
MNSQMPKRFYDALREAIEATGVSLQTACAESGVSYEQAKKFMQRAAKNPNVSTNVDDAVKLANAYGFTLDEFLGDQTAAARSEAAALWRSLSYAERKILLDAARGRLAP